MRAAAACRDAPASSRKGKLGTCARLRRVGDPLLVVLPAPLRHQRMQRIPVRHPVGLGGEARVGAPVGRSHRLEPRRPLLLLARRDRGIAVARRQDRHRRAVAVGQALARPSSCRPRPARASSVMASVASASWIDTSIDAPGWLPQRRMHAGTGGGQSADERGLLADRDGSAPPTDRRPARSAAAQCRWQRTASGRWPDRSACGPVSP